MHHYIDCGLRNVYLLNGYCAIKTSAGLRVSVADLYGLHHCVAMWIVEHQPRMRGVELRFLRRQLAITQTHLAYLLGCSQSSIGVWERKRSKQPVPKAVDRLMRLLYQDYANRSVRVRATIDRLLGLGLRRVPERLVFKDTETGWQMVARQWSVECPLTAGVASPPAMSYTSLQRTGAQRLSARIV